MSVNSEKLNDFSKTQSYPLTRESLAKLRLRGKRSGTWFRDLKQKERMLLDLTIRVVEKVHSFLLAKILSGIVKKLCEAMESRVVRLIRTEGPALAKKVSKIAQFLGNKSAKSWALDRGFMQFLVITNLGALYS